MLGAAELTDELVRRAAEGSKDDLGRVMEAMQPQVRMMVVARLSPAPEQLEAVDEVAQQVMVALTSGICRLESRSAGGLKAFVSGIVTRKVSDLLKKRGEGKIRLNAASLDSTVTALSEAGPLGQFLSCSGTSPLSAAERAERAGMLILELGRLKPEHREVITLAFFDQLPIGTVAAWMDLSRPAASMLLIRAVQTLRRKMTGSSKVERLREGSV
ncbi:MAG: hypothetical protein JSU86_03820 [Phycisphaerales bacterium]|nr:MAG: hypothetical protein JSU86_03820 [Phycisphaerales bacterium]